MSAQTASLTEPVHPPEPTSRSTPLVVLVAPTTADRTDLLARLDATAAVLVVPSVAVVRQLMEPPAGARRVEAPSPARAADAGPPTGAVTGVRVHEDRHAVGFGSAEVSLTPLEFALLRLLMREPGRVWRFDELVRRVWGTDHLGDASQVHAVVKRLRAKLAREHAPVAIEAVRGVGFRAVRPAAGQRVVPPTG